MKQTKRILATLMAVVMMAAMMVVPASAAGEYKITINGTAEGHTYEAYQIFKGTLADSGILSNIQWGDGVDGTALLAALKADDTLKSYFTACDTAAQVAEKLALTPFTDLDSVYLDAFAKIVATKLTTVKGTSSASGEPATTYTISNLNAGYYLVKDVYATDPPAGELEKDAYTKYMLYVVKNISITPKAAVPTVTKTISKLENSNYGDSASVTISRDAYFRLTGTLHDRINEYPTYKYVFVDTLPEGFTLADKNGDRTIDTKDFTFAIVNTADSTSVEVPGTIIADHEEECGEIFAKTTDGFTLTFADVKAFIKDVTGSDAVAKDTIQVTYAATLDKDAVVTDGADANKVGNVNTVKLKYSTDPNQGASGPMGITAASSAAAFTYKLQVNKVDANGSPLAGAQFILYHEPGTAGSATIYGIFEKKADGVYRLINFSTVESDATTLDVGSTDANKGVLIIEGLGSATFKLKETKAPSDEYNLLQGAASVTMTDDRANAVTQSINIINHKGATLPETGGMGTTAFYIAGIALMIGAAAVLITKKRGAQN